MYGFHKIPHLQQGVLKSDSETEFWNFEHPNFHRGQPDLLCLVTRKNSKGVSQQNADLADGDAPVPGQGSTQLLDVNSLVSGITAIKRHQQTISADLNELKTSNQHLWQEALISRERYKSQQDTINRILKFLAGVFGHATSHEGKDVDGGASTPLVVRRSQRLLIGNGSENNKPKGVEVVEVEDDDNKSVAEPMLTDEQPGTPRKWCFCSVPPVYPALTPPLSVPFAQIDASVKSASVTPSTLFGSAMPSPSSETYFHDRASGRLTAPTWASAPSIPTSTPTPALSSTSNHSALELHRPQSTRDASPTPPPTQDQLMQAAFQQLMQSPSHVQRLMQLLSSGSTNGPTPIPTPMTGPAQSGSWTPPATLDLPQLALAQLAFHDNSIGGGGNSVLTFDSDRDIVGPSATHLAEDEARLARTYHDASEIDADVDVLQANINALIENMGFDSAALATTSTTPSATSTHPPPPLPTSEGGMPPPQTPTDFDFESFLTAFTDAQGSEVGATDVVADDSTSSVPRSVVSVSASGTGTDATNVSKEQSVLTGLRRKRTSDVAELELPLPEPPKSMLSSRAVAETRTDAAGDLPRAKRNKK